MTNDDHEDDRARRPESDDDWVDELGRKAGGALRKPAPVEGLSDLSRRRTSMRRTRLAAGAAVTALLIGGGALVVRAASDEDDERVTVEQPEETTATSASPSTAPGASTTLDATTTSATTPTTGEASTTVAASPAVAPEVQWALDYTGGTAGPATGTPVRIGAVTETNYFSDDWWAAADAAVAFLNGELGGIGGHPVELVKCSPATTEDAIACGQQFAADTEMKLVAVGTVNAVFYENLGPTKAMLIGLDASPSVTVPIGTPLDQVPGFSFAAPVSWQLALLGFAAHGVSPSVDSIVYAGPGVVPGIPSLDEFLQRFVGSADLQQVSLPGEADAATLVSTLGGVPGFAEADVLALWGLESDWCYNLPTALEELQFAGEVVGLDTCFFVPDAVAALQQQGIDGAPDGWYVTTPGYLALEPDLDSGWATYAAKVVEYSNRPDRNAWLRSGYGSDAFTSLLTLVRLADLAGGIDVADSATIRGTLVEYPGPMMMQAGPIECGTAHVVAPEISPMLCSQYIGVYQHLDGEWIRIGDVGIDGIPTGAA